MAFALALAAMASRYASTLKGSLASSRSIRASKSASMYFRCTSNSSASRFSSASLSCNLDSLAHRLYSLLCRLTTP